MQETVLLFRLGKYNVNCQCGFIKAPVTDPLPNMICNSLDMCDFGNVP